MKVNKKVVSFATAATMLLGTASFAAVPDGSVVLKDKGFDIDLLFGADYLNEINSAVAGAGDALYYNLDGTWKDIFSDQALTAEQIAAWPAVNYTNEDGSTSVYAEGNGEIISDVLTVDSINAVHGAEVLVKLLNVPAEIPAASAFVVTDSNANTYAATNIAATGIEGEYKITLGTEVTGKGTLTVTYGDSSATKEFDTTVIGLTLAVELDDEDSILVADGADDTIVKVTVKKDGEVYEGFEGTVKFQSLKGASFAKETVAFDKGVAEVQLTSMSSAVTIQDTVIATISEAPQNTDFVGESIQVGISYVPEEGNGETGEKVFITYAESDKTSDIFVKFNKDIDFAKVKADFVDNGTIKVSDDKGISFKAIKDMVKIDGKTVKLVLMEENAVSDNKEILIQAKNSGIAGMLIDSEYKFNLVDHRAPEALSVTNPDYRTIVTKFTEPVSKTAAEVVGNWVLNGHQLTEEDVVFVSVGKDMDESKSVEQPSEIYTIDGIDNRNFVTIRLTSTGSAYLKKDAAGNPKMNLLQAYDMIDYAGLTDQTGQNKATTQEFTFMTPAAPSAPTAEVFMDSPEQYRVVFSTDVQTRAGGDLTKEHFGFKYQSKADPKNADGTVKYAESIPTADDTVDADSVVVTKISDKEYLLEMNRDWTQELDTQANNINYYTPDNNHVQITVKNWADNADKEIINFNDVAMASHLDKSFTLSLDDVEPEILNAQQVMDTLGNPLKRVEVTMSEPVQMVDSLADSLMTANATASQNQGIGGVPVPTYEFVSADLKTTIEGKLVDGSLEQVDKTFEIEPIEPAKLTPGKWTVYVRSISDDIGNTSATEKYEVEIKATETEKGKAQIIWADAHDNADLDNNGLAESDVVHVQFGTEMSLDALKSNVYTVDGEPLPTGVKITSEEVQYDSNENGAIDAADLEGTLVTITLPNTFLGKVNEDVVDDIDVENPDLTENQDEPHILNVSKQLNDVDGNAILAPTEVELTYVRDGYTVIHHWEGTTPENTTPVVDAEIADQNMTLADGVKTIDASATFTDADGDTLTLTGVSADEAVATVVVNGTDVQVTPVAAGTVNITVTANDGKTNGTVSDVFVVTVTEEAGTEVTVTNVVIDDFQAILYKAFEGTVEGTNVEGLTVKLSDSMLGTELGTTTVNADGTFSMDSFASATLGYKYEIVDADGTVIYDGGNPE
jgi:hypothetical protein